MEKIEIIKRELHTTIRIENDSDKVKNLEIFKNKEGYRILEAENNQNLSEVEKIKENSKNNAERLHLTGFLIRIDDLKMEEQFTENIVFHEITTIKEFIHPFFQEKNLISKKGWVIQPLAYRSAYDEIPEQINNGSPFAPSFLLNSDSYISYRVGPHVKLTLSFTWEVIKIEP